MLITIWFRPKSGEQRRGKHCSVSEADLDKLHNRSSIEIINDGIKYRVIANGDKESKLYLADPLD